MLGLVAQLIMTTSVLPQLENVLLCMECPASGCGPPFTQQRRINMQRQGQLGGVLVSCLGASPAWPAARQWPCTAEQVNTRQALCAALQGPPW